MNDDPTLLAYRALACAILWRAIRDARRSRYVRHWLIRDPWAADLMAALDLDRDAAIDTIQKLAYNDNRVEAAKR